MSTATTHYSAPYTIPAAQWQAFAEGTVLRLVLGELDYSIDSAEYTDDGRLLVTANGGMVVGFDVDEDVTVRAPRTTFAALRNL